MSVTFSIDSVGTGKYEFTCYAGTATTVLGPYASRDEGIAATLEHARACEECGVYRPYVSEIPDVAHEMNVSNANASMLFEVLGVDWDWCGAMDADEFLGYVLVALGMPLDDSGVAPSEYQAMGPEGPTGPRVIDCGRSPGYVSARLQTLSEMAVEAKRLGRQITWG